VIKSAALMAGSSDIEWTEATWNPIAGCTIVVTRLHQLLRAAVGVRLQAMGSTKYQGTTRKSGGGMSGLAD